jgi:MtrB/PioB family decaheme-associated outer membrane protein
MVPLVVALGLAVPVLAQPPATEPTPAVEPTPAAATDSAPGAGAEEASAAETPPVEELAAQATLVLPAQPVTPQDPARRPILPSGFRIRRLDFGVSGAETDVNSSKFREYRSVPTGAVLPFLRFAGEERFRYDVAAWNVLQDDAQYFARAEPGPLTIDASFVKIPHAFGNDARSLLEDTGRGTLSLSDTLQQTFQTTIAAQHARNPSGVTYAFLNPLVSPSLAGEDLFDVDLLRERGQLDLALTRDTPVEVRLTYFHEKRRGDRGSGTAFGFGNVVETPEPIDYRTQDVRLSAEWGQGWGLLRGAVSLNQFTNSIPVQSFDNPFRAVSSTDANAYQAPASSSIGGASFARLALPPDNRAVTGALGMALKLGKKTRLSADASLGQWTQDEPFIPFTTNAAITTPVRATDAASLPAASLGGEINVFSFSSLFSTRPVDGLSLTARYRRYDLGNDTPRIRFADGYVRFDAVWEDIPRISVPYGYTNDQAQATAAYDFGALSLEGGYRYERMARTFRETEHTTQSTLFASAGLQAADWALLRATVEQGNRDFDHYDPEESEHASFLEPGPPANLTLLRRFDQATKDTTRLVSELQLSPGGNTTVALSYIRARDDYEESSHGLINAENEAFTAEVDFTPSDRFSVFAFYTREDISSFQRGRQSGATLSTREIDDWTADVRDKVDSLGGGVNLALVKDRLDLGLTGSWQKVDGNNDLESPPGGAPDVAFDIPLFDDSKLLTLSAELAYKFRGGWRLAVGGWLEDYEVRDANTTGVTNYMPASFFLAAIDSDYRAQVLYARASYSW